MTSIAAVIALGALGAQLLAGVPSPSRTTTTPPATSSPTSAVPTGPGRAVPEGRRGPVQSGQTIYVPEVPDPATTTDRTFGQPDRPDPAVPTVSPPGFVAPPAGSGLSRYTGQTAAWTSCTVEQVTGQCATVRAPLDYAAPDGQAITLALFKVPATTSPRSGTLFVNPGGPGEPGRSLAATFNRDGLESYDIVGWDPRGTGESTPVQCANGEVIDALMALDTTPDTQEELDALVGGWRQFGEDCLARSGPLLAHISTEDTVKDLDLLRVLVGDATLSFLGYSYGTQIGSLYAERYPDKVGRMVLDSAVNITKDESIIQATGFDTSLHTYSQWCVNQGSCPLGASPQAVTSTVTGLLDSLDTRPLTVGTRRLTQGLAADGIALFFYFDESAWGTLTQSIQQALSGQGSALLRAADLLRGRGDDGQYATSFFAFPAIGCADSADDGIARALADWKRDSVTAPIFGHYFGPNLTCTGWPVKATAPVDVHAAGAAPIVVVGAVGDSATPYPYAVWMAEQLQSGVLVTFAGNGHATFGNGRSACVDHAVVSFLADGVVPPYGLHCQ